MNCWSSKTPFQTALILILIVAIPFFLALITVYVLFGLVWNVSESCGNLCHQYHLQYGSERPVLSGMSTIEIQDQPRNTETTPHIPKSYHVIIRGGTRLVLDAGAKDDVVRLQYENGNSSQLWAREIHNRTVGDKVVVDYYHFWTNKANNKVLAVKGGVEKGYILVTEDRDDGDNQKWAAWEGPSLGPRSSNGTLRVTPHNYMDKPGNLLLLWPPMKKNGPKFTSPSRLVL